MFAPKATVPSSRSKAATSPTTASAQPPPCSVYRRLFRAGLGKPATVRLGTVVAVAVALAALVAPALYNGFPLVFYDTGAYLARAFVAELEPGRGPFYGFFIAAAGGRISLWPVIVVQGVLTLWLLSLTLRLHGFAAGRIAAGVALGLSAATTAAWGVATVMPDVFAPLAVLAWYVLSFGGGRLGRAEMAGAAGVLLLAVPVHMTHLALVLGLALCPGVLLLVWRPALRRGVAVAMAISLAALVLMPLVNGAFSGQFGFTPGGQTFIFGRMVQSGLIGRYLDEHCPSPEIRLCAYKGAMPINGDEWIWDADSPFYALGGWQGDTDETRRIILGSLADHPWRHLQAAAAAAVEQFTRVGTGEDIDAWYWHTDKEIETRLPSSLPAYAAGLQHNTRLGSFALSLNRLYVPLTQAAVAVLVLLMAIAGWRGRFLRLPGTVLLALAGNAVICGVLSGPHDRYQGRLAWLAPFAVIVAIGELVLDLRRHYAVWSFTTLLKK